VQQQTVLVKNPYYDSAYTYLDQGLADSAFFAFSQAKDLFIAVGDSLNTANCLINMAITQKDQGDYFGAQETGLQALDYLNKNNSQHHIYLSTNYNNLGAATVKLNDYDLAISFFKKAIEYSVDPLNTTTYHNNIAYCFQNLGRYSEAVQIYEEVLEQSKSNDIEYARVLSNLARTKWLEKSDYYAIPELLLALRIREREADLFGLNASYVHLSDYYTSSKPDSALFYAHKQYAVAQQIKNADDQLKALTKLIELSPLHKSRSYFKIYQHLSDSVQQARSAAKNQFALIRYEVEKNKSDNLLLQKDNAEKTVRLTKQRVLIGGVTIVLIVVIVGGTFYYRRRKQRLELESQNRINETQLYLSKKVHDVVANDIYRVMTEVEYKDDLDREGLLDKLEIIYNQSRDISHNVEQRSTTEIPYNEQISTLLKSFASNHHRISIAGNDAEQWTDVSKRIKEEIKHVLQELMVNMKKHSDAKLVVVRFERLDRQLKIFYKDNGVGLLTEISHGKGMRNTVSRIESLGGEIIFVSEPGKGLSITANIPLI